MNQASQTVQRFTEAASPASMTSRRAGPSGRASLSDLLRLLDADAPVSPESDSFPVVLRPVRAGTALFHEHGEVHAIHFISMGWFKTYRTAEDGYEQVLGFARRGEVLGYDAVCLGRHPTTAVALEDSRVFAIDARDLFKLLQRVPALDRLLHLAVSRQLTRAAEVAYLMAAVAAEVRLARFLVLLSGQMSDCGQSPARLLLRMGRRDIASHLGVAHETVSRSFGLLVDWGLLRVNNREVEILDLGGLRSFARSTRRPVDDIDAKLARSGSAKPAAAKPPASDLIWAGQLANFGFADDTRPADNSIGRPLPRHVAEPQLQLQAG